MAQDIFDQLAAGNNNPSPQAPPAATPQSTTQQAAQPTAQPSQGQGDIFTQLAAQSSQPQQAAPVATIRATPGSMPSDSLPSKVTLWARNLAADLRDGGQRTDIGRLYTSIGGQPLSAGQGEGVGDVIGSPILGPLRTTQGVSELPQSGRHWQGVKDTVGGVLDTATIPGSFVAPEAGEIAAAGGDAALEQAGRAAKAVRGAVSVKALQPKLQGAITSAIHDAAAEHGVTIPEGTNLRDVTQTLSNALRSKAHDMYASLDTALGGTRFQSFAEAIDNVQRAIRDEVGLDPARDKQLSDRLADAKAARDAAIEQIQTKGIDPATIDQADALHRRAMALQDVSKAVRASTDVHPSQLATGSDATAATNVRTKPLWNRLQQLATPNPKYPGTASRLVQALGEDRAASLLHDVDAAHLAAQKIAARNAWIKRGAAAVGLAGLGHEVFSGLHGLLSDGQ